MSVASDATSYWAPASHTPAGRAYTRLDDDDHGGGGGRVLPRHYCLDKIQPQNANYNGLTSGTCVLCGPKIVNKIVNR